MPLCLSHFAIRIHQLMLNLPRNIRLTFAGGNESIDHNLHTHELRQ